MKACSFCDKTITEVKRLVERFDVPNGPAICEQCVEGCVTVIRLGKAKVEEATKRSLQNVTITFTLHDGSDLGPVSEAGKVATRAALDLYRDPSRYEPEPDDE